MDFNQVVHLGVTNNLGGGVGRLDVGRRGFVGDGVANTVESGIPECLFAVHDDALAGVAGEGQAGIERVDRDDVLHNAGDDLVVDEFLCFCEGLSRHIKLL